MVTTDNVRRCFLLLSSKIARAHVLCSENKAENVWKKTIHQHSSLSWVNVCQVTTAFSKWATSGVSLNDSFTELPRPFTSKLCLSSAGKTIFCLLLIFYRSTLIRFEASGGASDTHSRHRISYRDILRVKDNFYEQVF